MEEKAKILKAAKLLIECSGTDEHLKKELLTKFPELAESEDERVRKNLIRMVRNVRNDSTEKGYYDIPFDKYISYLEKQKEQKSIEHLELKAGHWYICHRAYCCRADHLTVKEGERFMCEKDGVVKGFVIKNPEEYFREVEPPAPYDDEKQKEQKPAEWSEEDEEMYEGLIYDLQKLEKLSEFPISINSYKWLKSRFKLLRPRPHWKPSKEQMKTIYEVKRVLMYGTPAYVKLGLKVEDLETVLKKLTEE